MAFDSVASGIIHFLHCPFCPDTHDTPTLNASCVWLRAFSHISAVCSFVWIENKNRFPWPQEVRKVGHFRRVYVHRVDYHSNARSCILKTMRVKGHSLSDLFWIWIVYVKACVLLLFSFFCAIARVFLRTYESILFLLAKLTFATFMCFVYEILMVPSVDDKLAKTWQFSGVSSCVG
jgi:hypothetical protein